MEKFWLVWSEESGQAKHKHLDELPARKEAERLAKLHPDIHFCVM
jgi:hypothetical protein